MALSTIRPQRCPFYQKNTWLTLFDELLARRFGQERPVVNARRLRCGKLRIPKTPVSKHCRTLAVQREFRAWSASTSAENPKPARRKEWQLEVARSECRLSGSSTARHPLCRAWSSIETRPRVS